MPVYVVRLTGPIAERWRVEAETPEEAESLVRSGKGDMVGDQEWKDRPEAEIVDPPEA